MKETNLSTEQEQLVKFKVRNEEWNIYELEDRTLLKTKFVLVNIVKTSPEKHGGYNALLNTSYVTGVFSPKEIRGPPGRKYSTQELKENIVEPNLKFKQLVDGGWNEYETDNALIQIRTTLKSVDKTSLFDSAGMPAYLINYENIITAKPKKKQ